MAHSIAASLSHRPQGPVVALRGPAPLGASRDGPPSPRRLEQPSPCTSPISDAPRHHSGTARRFQNRREAGLAYTFRCAPRVDPRDLDRHHAAPCGAGVRTIGTPSVVSQSTGLPRPPMPLSAFCLDCAARPRAPFSPRSRRPVRQHVERRAASASAVLPTRLAAHRTSRRAMRRTDFCLLTSSYEYPRLVGSRHVVALARSARSGTSPVSRQCDSLRWAAHALQRHRGGRSCSRRNVCVPDL
jgi:hypothetical protein